ncbi:DUF945 family protein [Photobacterium lipolyticum]|uniref:DUF945 domain-containing protein n=1 Tax=Photobacterium lipolyticum TaxID=266810 RepID=A0A2T3MSJ3_9GAMM|nr:DUF945 family protein [Photobacterium lipolyticum]PSW01128.1 DUF945 domain-containing protein [Photobacterium lipolyticum]
MLKKVAAAGGAVVIALCWPFATGQVGERIYLDTVGKYDSPYVSITNANYDRGYLSSDAVSRIEIKDAFKAIFEDEGLPTVWYIEHKVKHGLFGVSSVSSLVLDEAFQPIANDLWGDGVAPITFTTSTALTRKTDFNITINPVSYMEETGTKADIKAFVMEGTVDAEGASEFRYRLPEAKIITLADEAMVMKGFVGGGKGVLDGQFWIGSQNFSLNSVSFIDQVNDKSVDVEDVTLAMSNTLTQPDPASDIAEQHLTNLNTVTIAKIISLDGEEFSNFNFKMAFADLNYRAISRLGDMADELDDQMTAEQAKEASLALDLLVAKGLTFNLEDLSVTTPQGDVKSNINVVIAPGIARASENIAQITDKLSGQINLILPQAIVDEDPILSEKAAMMEQGGVVVKESGQYKMQLQIDGDQIVLASGEQLPLAMLLMLFM